MVNGNYLDKFNEDMIFNQTAFDINISDTINNKTNYYYVRWNEHRGYSANMQYVEIKYLEVLVYFTK